MADDQQQHPGPSAQVVAPPVMQIPDSVRAAWGLGSRPARGPRPALSLDRIVRAAITVAGREGLDAVSMGRVAAELGSSPMSLYRYVGSKDELLALMVDAAMGLLPQPVDGDGWRANLTRWSLAALRAYLDSPWMVRVPIPAPPITPNQIRAMEAGLRCLRGTALTYPEKLSTILLISGLVRYYGTLVADFRAASAAVGGVDPSAGYGRAVLGLLDPERFPEVVAAIGSGTLDDEDPDFAFTEVRFGLDRILDGLESLIAGRGSTA